ncbi:hypothetical protein [Kitasatospora sp. NPDC051914]|uniref:hypothetical protein n=1 Tax=Kitasatospora sp. NPDC051914 TaxID=3154945 RepID=UPI003419ABAF
MYPFLRENRFERRSKEAEMKLDSARSLKQEFLHQLRTGEALAHRAGPESMAVVERRLVASAAPESPSAGGVAIGIAPTGRAGDYNIGVQVQDQNEETRRVVRYLAKVAPGETVVQFVGRVRPMHTNVARPLVPGVSIGHPMVGAGTLGAFVKVAGSSNLHALSNNHVLAASNRGVPGDPIHQPGPYDHKTANTMIGVLATAVDLIPGDAVANIVDAATCEVDESLAGGLEPAFPYGISNVTAPEEGLAVKKIGRTTDETDGSILMFELRNLWVDYGDSLGVLTFDNQIAIIGQQDQPFSSSGDSGSLVFSVDPPAAVGLLFAGSETGPGGQPVTYANPIDPVLEQIHATLAF